VSLYAAMLKLNVRKARAKIKITFWGEGSVKKETVEVKCTGVDSVLEIDSDEDPAKIAHLARVSEAGCYVIQSLRNPTPVSYRVMRNGEELDPNLGKESG